MLGTLRKTQTKFTKWLLILLAATFLFGFGFIASDFGVGSRVPQGVAAKVNGEEIPTLELYKTIDLLRDRYRQFGIPQESAGSDFITLSALNTLIELKLLSQKAREIGIRVTDEELRDSIMSNAAFQENGKFSFERYKDILRYGFKDSISEFERRYKEELLATKLRVLIEGTASITDEELLDIYKMENEKVNLEFVSLSPEDFKNSVSASEDEIKGYYEAHKDEIKTPELRKIRYIALGPKDFEDKVSVSEDEMGAYYNIHSDEFSTDEKEVRARHILIKSEDRGEEKAKKEAEEILKKVKSGESFEELASKYSEDGGSKTQGGDLGFFKQDKMVKPFSEKAFSMKPGDVDVVKTQFGYHVIKVDEVREAGWKEPFEKARERVEQGIREGKALDILNEFLKNAEEELQSKELSSLAGEIGAQIKESQASKMGDSTTEVPRDVVERAFLMGVGNKDIVRLGDKNYIIELTDIIPAREKTLEEGGPEIKERLALEKARGLAKKRAEEILEKAKSKRGLEKVAKSLGLKVEETGLFSRPDRMPKIGSDEEIKVEAFSLSKEKPFPKRVFEVGGKFYVISFRDRQPVDTAKFEENKENLKNRELARRRSQLLRAWIEKLRTESKISVNEALLSDQG